MLWKYFDWQLIFKFDIVSEALVISLFHYVLLLVLHILSSVPKVMFSTAKIKSFFLFSSIIPNLFQSSTATGSLKQKLNACILSYTKSTLCTSKCIKLTPCNIFLWKEAITVTPEREHNSGIYKWKGRKVNFIEHVIR